MEIKQNNIDGLTELWAYGEFLAAWKTIEIPEESIMILNRMMLTSVDYGKKLKSNEIKKSLGIQSEQSCRP